MDSFYDYKVTMGINMTMRLVISDNGIRLAIEQNIAYNKFNILSAKKKNSLWQ